MGDDLLAGVTVVDLSREPGGAYAAKLLADFGADVIKVEPPEGDPIRREGPFAHSQPGPETSLLFAYLNGHKRSLTLDLARRDDRATLDRLLARVDVLIESFSPAQALEYGITPDRMRSINPRLVHASVSPLARPVPTPATRPSIWRRRRCPAGPT
jgi:crotonobetainyl-CoA:carnitine CoA-transferase CaiB-like acyl-CoA transferase